MKILNVLWHSDWQVQRGTAFSRRKEEIPLSVSVMEENSIPARPAVQTQGTDGGRQHTLNDFHRQEHFSRQCCSCFYLCLLSLPLEVFLEVTI